MSSLPDFKKGQKNNGEHVVIFIHPLVILAVEAAFSSIAFYDKLYVHENAVFLFVCIGCCQCAC